MFRRIFIIPAVAMIVACAPASTEPAADTAAASAKTDTVAAQAAPPVATATTATPKPVEEKPMSAYENKIVDMKTSAGTISIRFFPEAAPNHVKNFIDLSEQGYYNGTKFHRVIPGFMIQGGDPNTKNGDTSSWGMGGSGKNLKAEFNPRSHKRGIVSMARSQDPDSASSQFFIVVKDSTFLDRQYTVFGEVVSGMEVADAIVSAPKGAQDRPTNPIAIESMTVRDAENK